MFSSDEGVDGGGFIDVISDVDLWLVLEEPVDEPIRIRIPEVVIEHPHGEIVQWSSYANTALFNVPPED